jgi:tetratricopeptide (TPR) repeat protein
MTFRRLLPALSLTLTLALNATSIADEITLIAGSTIKASGSRVRGTITSESPTEVKIGNQTVPVDQIEKIRYDGQPASMTLAETRESNATSATGLADAAELYQKAVTEVPDKPLLIEAAQFRRAQIFADLAQADPTRVNQAVETLDSFIKSHSKSRHLGPALEALARLYLQKENFDKAASTLKQLDQIPWAASRAAVLQARVLARRGQYDQAVAALDRLLGTVPEGSEKHREAMLAKAESLAGMKKFDDAEATVRAVIKAAAAEDAEVQALAHNTLGDCLRAAGRRKDALFAYLQTDILYDKDKEQRARALAQIVQLWHELNRDDRAEEALERLKQDYPHSPWVAAASKPRS